MLFKSLSKHLAIILCVSSANNFMNANEQKDRLGGGGIAR